MLVSTARWLQVPVNHRGDWLFVELVCDNGLTGWGEASHSGNDTQTAQWLSRICEALTGAPIPAQGLPDALLAIVNGQPKDKVLQTAVSAIEQAITDCQAQQLGQSVAQLLGESSACQVPIYTNLNRMCADRSPSTVAAAGRQALAGGVNRMKFAPFDEVNIADYLTAGIKTDALLEPGRERLGALRSAVGPAVSLMIDCHWRFPPEALPDLVSIAREFSIDWIEDPFPELTRALSTQLREETGALVTGGEAFLHYEDFETYLRQSGVDVLIADVKHVGGVHALDRLCKLAADYDTGFAPHNPSGPVSTAASAHICVANSNAVLLEYPFGEVAWRSDFCPTERVTGEYIDVTGPGLGVTLNLRARP